MPGICEIKPQPHSVEEATYVGQLETFQYTLVRYYLRILQIHNSSSILKPNDVYAVESASHLVNSVILDDIDMETQRMSFTIARLVVPIANIIAPILTVRSIPRMILPLKRS
jgi:hypothetical protein